MAHSASARAMAALGWPTTVRTASRSPAQSWSMAGPMGRDPGFGEVALGDAERVEEAGGGGAGARVAGAEVHALVREVGDAADAGLGPGEEGEGFGVERKDAAEVGVGAHGREGAGAGDGGAVGIGLDESEVELAFGKRHDVVDRARRGVGAAAHLAGEAAVDFLADGAGGRVVAPADGSGADGEEGEVGASGRGGGGKREREDAEVVRRMGQHSVRYWQPGRGGIRSRLRAGGSTARRG